MQATQYYVTLPTTSALLRVHRARCHWASAGPRTHTLTRRAWYVMLSRCHRRRVRVCAPRQMRRRLALSSVCVLIVAHTHGF